MLAIPHHRGEIHIELMKSILALDKEGFDMGIADSANAEVSTNRNILAQKFVSHSSKPTHLLFVDSDTGLPRDTVKKLLEADKPIISGVQVTKFANTWIPRQWGDLWNGLWNVQVDVCETLDLRETHWIPKEEYRDKVIEIGATGGGCLMIKREVLETVPYPWFYNEINPNATMHKDLSFMSEDISFCYKAKKYGFGVHLHIGVLCDHWIATRKFPPFWEKPKAEDPAK